MDEIVQPTCALQFLETLNFSLKIINEGFQTGVMNVCKLNHIT